MKLQTRLVRLISAKADMDEATDAFTRFEATSDRGERRHFFNAMVIANTASGFSTEGGSDSNR
jgi:hypothetical protein